MTDSAQPQMFYFGPWSESGHFLHDESGRLVRDAQRGDFPWSEGEIDSQLQPHRDGCNKRSYCGCGSLPEGQALLYKKDGWTALCFWDRSVDKRPGCNSNYFARGDFTFAEMVEISKARFAYRWNRMNFAVTEVIGSI